MKKKILIFCESLGNKSGGAEKVMCQLANFLNSKNYKIKFAISQNFVSYRKFLNSKIKILNFKNAHYIFSLFSLFFFIKKKDNLDLIISTDFNCNIISIIIGILKKKKILIRETTPRLESLKLNKTFSYRIKIKLINFFYKFANTIICPSYACRNDLIKINKNLEKKIITIQNPIDFKQIIKLKNKNKVKNNSDYFLTIGRLEKHKNFDHIILAFKEFLKENKKEKLCILGSGSYKLTLLNLIKKENLTNSVSLKSFTKNPYPIMNKAKCIIIASNVEGCPNILLEAFALQKTVICSNFIGYKEIIENKKWAYVFDLKNKYTLVKAMKKFATSKPRTIPKKYFYKKYRHKLILKKYEDKIISLINNN